MSMCCCTPFNGFPLTNIGVHNDVAPLTIGRPYSIEDSFDRDGIGNLCVPNCVPTSALSRRENVRVKLEKKCFPRDKRKKVPLIKYPPLSRLSSLTLFIVGNVTFQGKK